MDYSPLEKLTKQLEEQVTTLKSGQMNPSELHGLVRTAREVYERLVILEFQSLEQAKAPKAPEPLVTPFKISTESSEEATLAKEEVTDYNEDAPPIEPEAEPSIEEIAKEETKETPVIKIAESEPVTVEPEATPEEAAPEVE
ncbi:MAG: hypothetical protein AB8B53_13740, partial [Flavobacteriales bacterium]